jgi:imidazolonepropionase-like amidohydrolase
MKFFLNLIFCLTFYFSNAQDLYLHCGAVVDVDQGKVLKEMTLIVRGNKIFSVKPGYLTPNSNADEVIDLKGKTVLPGLIDMHVHIEFEYSAETNLNRFIMNESDIAFHSVVNAKKTLLAGFTTVRDLGGTGVNISLRNAVNNGLIDGPRIYAAGKSIATTGGHADPTNGMKKNLMETPGPTEGVVNGVDEARQAVRQRYKDGSDVIKITATGGVLSVAKNGHNPQFTVEEIKAICETAKDYGMHVAAHAHGDEGMQRAILGGVKTIEHGTLMSEKTMDLMKANKAYYVPTITAGKEVSDKAKIKGFYPEIVVPKAAEIGPKIQGTFGQAYKKGVLIAFGTDAGVFPHGLNAKEFGYMVEAGMPAMEAIQSATLTNAGLLMNENIGSISEGKLADIIAVNEDPLKNIKTLENVVFVMKDGKIYKQE